LNTPPLLVFVPVNSDFMTTQKHKSAIGPLRGHWASKKKYPHLKNNPGHPKKIIPISKTTLGIQKTLSPSQKQPWASKKADFRLKNDHGNPRGIPHLTKNPTSKKHSPVPKTTLCIQKAFLLSTERPSGIQDRMGGILDAQGRFWNGGCVFLDAHGRFWNGR